MGQILGSPHWLESSVLKDWSSPLLFREVKNVSNQFFKNLINRNYFLFLFPQILERIYHYWKLCNYWRWLSYPDTQLLTPLRVSLSEYLMKWDLETEQSFALCHFVKTFPLWNICEDISFGCIFQLWEEEKRVSYLRTQWWSQEDKRKENRKSLS